MTSTYTYALGVQEAPPDPRTARLTDFLIPAELPPIPTSDTDAITAVSPWDMLGNDSKGDCVVAGWAHILMLWSKMAGSPIRPTTQQVVDLYLMLTGGADVGLVIRKFLSYVRQNAALGGKKLAGYAAVDYADNNEAKIAIYLFGAVMRGILLPDTAVQQTGPNGRWRALQNLTDPDARPGSWGAHLTADIAYTPDTLYTVTWGMVQPVDLNFYPAYSMEAYCCIPTWPVPGFDYAKFVSYLKTISTDVDADPVPPDPAPPTPPPPGPSEETLNDRIKREMGVWDKVTGDLDLVTEKGIHWPVHFEGTVRRPT